MAITAVMLLTAVGLGVVIGHVAWAPSSSLTPVPSAPSSTAPSYGFPSSPLPSEPPTPSTEPSAGRGAPPDAAALAAKVDPGLVDIDVTDAYQATQGAGTGMVIGSGGEVLTNNHVIEGATTISVYDVGNHKTYGAKVVGYDRSKDVAVLQLAGASGLQTVDMGDSSTVVPGDGVVAVGNAQGRGGNPSYAGGSVTAINQAITAQDKLNGTVEHLSGLIETNADIIPGDSGGALLDATGTVIGMITAGSSGFQFKPSANQGYAIALDDAISVAKQIEAGEASSEVHIGPTPFLGVGVQSPSSGVAGAEIVEVVPGGPASQGGLAAADVITGMGGQGVTSPESLTDVLLGESPGDSVAVEFVDPSGARQSTTVTLQSGPAQ